MKAIKYISALSLLTMNMNIFAIDPVSILTMLCSGVSLLSNSKGSSDSLLGNVFTSKEQISLKVINFDIDKEVNNGAAIEVHIVIVYDESFFQSLKKLNSNTYFNDVDNLKKLNPNKMIILKFEFVAKTTITSSDISAKYKKDSVEPIGALVFAKYSRNQSSAAKHVAVIPVESKTITLKFKKDNFNLTTA